MKQITIITLIFLMVVFKGYAQDEQNKHFEFDAMLGMHTYSSSFFHAMNSVTWIQNYPLGISEFSGFGRSTLPALSASYFFKNNIGITAGFTAISANNELYIDDTTETNYHYCIDQFNISFGVSGKIRFKDSPLSLNVGSGFVVAPFDISKDVTKIGSSNYLAGNNSGLGYYGNASFQIKIIKFLNFKTEFSYSFIPAEISLKDPDGIAEQNIKNLNIGGITLKTGLSLEF